MAPWIFEFFFATSGKKYLRHPCDLQRILIHSKPLDAGMYTLDPLFAERFLIVILNPF